MNWEKLGCIFKVDKNSNMMYSHTSIPIPLQIDEELYRIFYSARDCFNKSRIFYFDINLFEPNNILYASKSPSFELGKNGDFDDSGVWPNCIVPIGDDLFLYYTGWHVRETGSYTTEGGIAIYNDKSVTFNRILENPILDMSQLNAFSIGVCDVKYELNKFRMWFESQNGSSKDSFDIEYAESIDGIHWHKEELNGIKKNFDETSFSRPSVLVLDKQYHIWFSYKIDGKYRIGYAISDDGISWDRKDQEVGIGLSEFGWDSEEIEYPYVFKYQNNLYMLYCGNGYGKTGIGIAKCCMF